MKDDDAARTFEEHRPMLEGVAYRMLGSLAEAQDMVQETWLRWARANKEEIRSVRSWLVTTCSRLCLDQLKSAARTRQEYVGPWLPEPFLTDQAGPGRAAEIDETVSIALMLALENLSPHERAALILHDVFDFNFGEISRILDKTEPACRKLASRAREHVRSEKPRFKATEQDHQRLLKSFLQAARQGDLLQLKSLFAGDVELRTDGGGKVAAARKILIGDDIVARFFVGVLGKTQKQADDFQVDFRHWNGSLGAVVYLDGEPVSAFSLNIDQDRIRTIYALRNPDKLRVFQKTGL